MLVLVGANAIRLNIIQILIGDEPLGFRILGPVFNATWELLRNTYPNLLDENSVKQINRPFNNYTCPEGAAIMTNLGGQIWDLKDKSNGYTVVFSAGKIK